MVRSNGLKEEEEEEEEEGEEEEKEEEKEEDSETTLLNKKQFSVYLSRIARVILSAGAFLNTLLILSSEYPATNSPLTWGPSANR